MKEIFITIIIVTGLLFNQDFSMVNSGLPYVRDARIQFGDIENDGDLDILFYGYATNNPGIYKNENNYFTSVSSGLPAVTEGGVAWSDFDKDNDLDILITGILNSVKISRLYTNTDNCFYSYKEFPGLSNSSCDFGDFDSDGFKDIVLTGSDISGNKIIKLYRNENGNFTEIINSLPGVTKGSVKCCDYDEDGDADFCISGLDSIDNEISKIFRNDSLNFVDIEAGITGFNKTYISWGDYDNDSDVDLLISGFTDHNNFEGYSDKALVYENDNNTFSDINAGLMFLYSSSWGDCDNDGDLDIILNGGVPESEGTIFYINDNGAYTQIDIGLPDVMASASAWGDYDNDGDEDFFLTGHYLAGQYFTIYYIANFYRNNIVNNILFIVQNILPLETELYQNYPNPFNPNTSISFSIPSAQDVKLSVYNSKGQLVKELANGKFKAGNYSVDFKGDDLNSGIYFYRLETGDKKLTKKMLLIK